MADSGASVRGSNLAEEVRNCILLGRGAFGEVFKVPDGTAVKKIIIEDNDQLTSARRELDLMMKMRQSRDANHVMVALDYHVVGHLSIDGRKTLYIKMLLADRSMMDVINNRQRHEQWSIVDRVDVSRQCFSGLSYLHGKGIVHRDVKPDNILFVDRIVKISDFGLARFEEEELIYESYMMGTYYYVAPEVVKGKQKPDKASDVYSMGIATAEWMTGKRAWGNIPRDEIVALKKRGEKPAILTDVPHDHDIRKVVSSCLNSRPGDRPTASMVMKNLSKGDQTNVGTALGLGGLAVAVAGGLAYILSNIFEN